MRLQSWTWDKNTFVLLAARWRVKFQFSQFSEFGVRTKFPQQLLPRGDAPQCKHAQADTLFTSSGNGRWSCRRSCPGQTNDLGADKSARQHQRW